MNDAVFRGAYVRVRARYDDQAWAALPSKDVTDLIYREIRVIDLERLMPAGADVHTRAVVAG
jgi:hypothetical protein